METHTKTIFISIFEGVEAKNILRTPILATLFQDPSVRVVLFTKSEEKKAYYQKQFSDQRIVYEVIEKKRARGFDSLFAKLKFTLLKTKTTDMKRRMAHDSDKNVVRFATGFLLNRLLAHATIRRIVRALDFLLVKSNRLDIHFKKYNPSLVFLAHLFDEPEIEILRAAKHFKVPTVGFVNSWDKVTARAMMRLLPDKIVVFNDIVKREVMLHNEIDEAQIFVSGLPQYDIYTSHIPSSRADFFARYGYNPAKKLIMYAPMGQAFGNTDWEMIDMLHKAIQGDAIKNAELLVRFQPNDFFAEEEFKKRPWLVYDYPGKRFDTKRGVDWDMDETDLKHLADTLQHVSLIISFASSISIDALAYDKPTINIGFEPEGKRPLQKSPVQYYHTEHYENVVKTDGVRMVHTPEMLITAANELLNNPLIGKIGRDRLKKEQWQFEDGKAGERIGGFLLEVMSGTSR